MTNIMLQDRLEQLTHLFTSLSESPYSIEIYIHLSEVYGGLGYPELAAGAVYKALLLIDAILDEDEYCEEAIAAVSDSIRTQSYSVRCEVLESHPNLRSTLQQATSDSEASSSEPDDEEVLVWVKERYAVQVYSLLAQYLHICGCWQSSYKYCDFGLRYSPENEALQSLKEVVRKTVHENQRGGSSSSTEECINIEDWPDSGFVRRECYPWNDLEPDRCSDESLADLNMEMAKVAPKFQVLATDLPNLTTSGDKSKPIKQLGVFAKEDIAPGEVVLKEKSLLTANNRLQDALCDACSVDLPELSTKSTSNSSQTSSVVSCEECQAVFCSQECLDEAMELYHPALCDKDVDSLARGKSPAEAADSLYLLLLLRSLALAETQDVHPLSLKELKYIWGDYSPADLDSTWMAPPTLSSLISTPSANMDKAFSSLPRTLPFSFSSNIVLPFHMLTKMDINIFTTFATYDVWIFNTLFAKFRGTASARLSGLGGQRIRGPEVSAVHPNWCLVNHSCDPHLRWEWGGEVTFTTRGERVGWKRDGEDKGRAQAGVKKGEEVLNHYCDVNLPVKERREWAAGSLGGPCLCDRCKWEAGEV